MALILAAALLVGFAPLPATDVEASWRPVDLRDWAQEGVPGNGNWEVASDGSSVLQRINGDPTFFLAPDNVSSIAVNGFIRVETSSDDDMIGFVLGHQSPIGAEGDPPEIYDMILLDWKRLPQTWMGHPSPEGFTLLRVQGEIPGSFTNYNNGEFIGDCLWTKDPHLCPEIEVLGTHHGSGTGWRSWDEYHFDLLYTPDRIQVKVTGGNGIYADGLVVFDITGDFQPGRIGFYNFSQANVRYSALQSNEFPVPVIAEIDPIECIDGSGTVTLDGSGSYDPDGDAITYLWTSPAGVFDDPTQPIVNGSFPVGTTNVTLTVSDWAESVSTTTQVTVEDTLMPTLNITTPRPGHLYAAGLEIGPVPGLTKPIFIGTVDIVVDAYDQCGPLTVRFEGPGDQVHETHTPPHTYRYDPGILESSEAKIRVVAADGAGHYVEDEIVFLQIGTTPGLE